MIGRAVRSGRNDRISAGGCSPSRHRWQNPWRPAPVATAMRCSCVAAAREPAKPLEARDDAQGAGQAGAESDRHDATRGESRPDHAGYAGAAARLMFLWRNEGDGRTYPFKIAGLGVGGIGVSTVDAEGEVYNLTSVSQFAGAYAAGQYGAVAGKASVGDIWLKNEHDVILHLKAKREGLMLSVGTDAVDIRLE